ncbi:GntR family transcriptional regulator [Nonomuraea sp. NN258]|uniref:GntR family transcriptional regulator n=1 Tax=Nonomuraea antri TaxID=2730852 RepID=UPI001569D68C|nr:GntR family transcriptional regulator [Nonomuraea antri]NRQ31873.1 GntR family transcriptional regulator [Nonomuraea antri]
MPREARYRQIARELGRDIETGRLPPGQRLPTEDALAERFGVHRLTARQAMVELRRTGLVETRQGLGSFVRRAPRRIEVSVDPATRRHRPADLKELAAAFGAARPAEVAGVAGAVPEEVLGREDALRPAAARHLGLTGGLVHEITTLLRTDGVPCVVSRYHLPPDWSELALVPAAGVFGSLGVEIEYVWHAVSAEPAGPSDQAVLGVQPGSAVLVREGLTAHGGRPLCHVERRCRGDLISFVTRYD